MLEKTGSTGSHDGELLRQRNGGRTAVALMTAAILLAGFGVVRGARLSPRSMASPVGEYRLAMVNGVRVPMVWHEVDVPEGGRRRLTWLSGAGEVRSDGELLLSLTARVTGVGVRGPARTDTIRGQWRAGSAGRVEIRLGAGAWRAWKRDRGDDFSGLTLEVASADLEGRRRTATMVLPRASRRRAPNDNHSTDRRGKP